MDFQEWLLAEGLSSSTARKYSGALTGALTKWGIENKIITHSLCEISDPIAFKALTNLIRATPVFSERNTRGNHMYGATLANYSRYLDHNLKQAKQNSTGSGPFSRDLAAIIFQKDTEDPFVPKNQSDARIKFLREVVRRQGQPKFRSNLIKAYEGKCAITGCGILMILDAAHVTPYLGPNTNRTSNGILLRTDLHSLWDQGLIAIDPLTMRTSVSPLLCDATYQSFDDIAVFQPMDLDSRIAKLALVEQWDFYRKEH